MNIIKSNPITLSGNEWHKVYYPGQFEQEIKKVEIWVSGTFTMNGNAYKELGIGFGDETEKEQNTIFLFLPADYLPKGTGFADIYQFRDKKITIDAGNEHLWIKSPDASGIKILVLYYY